jgi:hypothetical protein
LDHSNTGSGNHSLYLENSMTNEEEMDVALLMRLVAKAICCLQRVGLKRDANMLIKEAADLGIEIHIVSTPDETN